MTSRKPKIGYTEKRFALRIALPVAIVAAIAYFGSLALQLAWVDKNVADAPFAPNGEFQPPSEDLSKEENIAILQQATQSLHTAYSEQIESEKTTPEANARIERQRAEVDAAVEQLKRANEDEWRELLEHAYVEVNAYARVIGEENPATQATRQSAESS